MRWTLPVAGAVLMAVGGVWIFQGVGSLKGSFMTGQPIWLWIGVMCLVAGITLLVVGIRKSRS